MREPKPRGRHDLNTNAHFLKLRGGAFSCKALVAKFNQKLGQNKAQNDVQLVKKRNAEVFNHRVSGNIIWL